MKICAITNIYTNNYRISNQKKNDIHFKGFLSGTGYEYTDYFTHKNELGYSSEKFEEASNTILYKYSPLAHFSYSGKGIYIDDKLNSNYKPKDCYDMKYIRHYTSLDDIITKREEIELNLIGVYSQRLAYINKATNMGNLEKYDLLGYRIHKLYTARAFFNKNPQLCTDKIKKELEKTIQGYEKALSSIKW